MFKICVLVVHRHLGDSQVISIQSMGNISYFTDCFLMSDFLIEQLYSDEI